MIDILLFMMVFLAGALLGLVFFSGLWATVRRLPVVRYPAIWMLGSLTLRLGIIIAGFYFLARYGGWQHVLVATIGFSIMRFIVLRRLRSGRINTQVNEEANT